MDRARNFADYRTAIVSLPTGPSIDRDLLVSDNFLLDREDGLSVFYAPFDYVNTSARVALVGVTPGWTQMHTSFVVARDGLANGDTEETILRSVKRSAAFAGSMRTNLISMLDSIGLAQALGMASSETLFTEQGEALVHSTSSIRYPVFKGVKNYTGSTPPILRQAITSCYVELIARELDAVAPALVVPLGRAVETVMSELVRLGQLDESRCLFGFPHPSGANAHRPRQFTANRTALTSTVQRWAAAQ